MIAAQPEQPARGIDQQAEALAAFRRALTLDRNAGVKKDIERLEPKVAATPQE
ncbi:MAG: hypothetical protein J0I80_11575 [Sphingomonas sp.]|nr:hypothetical protein [Sphingomonas sp.]